MKKIKDRDYEEYQQYLYNTAHAYIWTPSTLDFICRGNDYDPEKIGKQLLEVYAKLKNEHISHMTSDKRRKYVIRSLRKSETELLKDFLYEAIFIPEGVEPPAKDIIEKPELRVYTDDFGSRKGDYCLVADFAGKVIGAVWTRIMNDVCCIIKVPKVAEQKRRKLHLHFGEKCSPLFQLLETAL